MDKTTVKHSFRFSVALGVLVSLLIAYGSVVKSPRSEQVPSREPDVSGRVMSLETNDGRTRFLVQSPKGGRCFVIVQSNTRIRTRDGETSEIAVGQTVSVWQTGMAVESHPPQVQVYAQWVIIEPNEPRAQ